MERFDITSLHIKSTHTQTHTYTCPAHRDNAFVWFAAVKTNAIELNIYFVKHYLYVHAAVNLQCITLELQLAGSEPS